MLQRSAAVLLIVALLYIPLIQAFHHHHNADPVKKSGKAYRSPHGKCPTCAYTSHLEGKQFFTISDPVVPAVFRPVAVVITTISNCKINKACLSGFTNKGPPQLS